MKAHKAWLNYGSMEMGLRNGTLLSSFYLWIGYRYSVAELNSWCIDKRTGLIFLSRRNVQYADFRFFQNSDLGSFGRSENYGEEWGEWSWPEVGRFSICPEFIYWKHDSSVSPCGPHLYYQHLAQQMPSR